MQNPFDRLPRNVLEDVFWAFRGNRFDDHAEFTTQVQEYQRRIRGEDSWRPDETVMPAPRVRVEYFGIASADDDEYQDFTLDLVADDGRAFTAGELLLKLHNEVVERLRDADHQYFEGLELQRSRGPQDMPVYRMAQGS